MSGYSSYSTPKKFMRLAPGTPPPLRSNNWDSMSYDSVLKKFYLVSNVLSLFYKQNKIFARFMIGRRRSKVPKLCFFQINFCQGSQQIEKNDKKENLSCSPTRIDFRSISSFEIICFDSPFWSFYFIYSFLLCLLFFLPLFHLIH